MMKFSDVDEAIREAERFVVRARAVKKGPAQYTGSEWPAGGELTAAMKRASMDLSKALAKLRKP